MFKNIKLLSVMVCALASPVQASISNFGYVTGVTSVNNNNVYFYTDGQRSNVASCQSDAPDRWKFDGTTPVGQLLMSTLLTAYASHKKVIVGGTGTCDADNETVQAINMAN